MLSACLTALVWIGLTQVGVAQQSTQSQAKSEAASAAKAPGNTELAKQAARLIRQLDAPEIAERDRAFAELVKLGPDVLAHLPTKDENVPEAVRDALRRLRREFDRQAADRAMQASTLTLAGKGLTLAKIAEAFEKQTGNKLVPQVEAEKTVDVTFANTPFWSALDTVADRAGLSVYPFATDGLHLRGALPGQRPASEGAFYAGPLRFQANEIRLQRDPRRTADASLKVSLEISWEPRLHPISIRQRLDRLQARDNQGSAIRVDGEGELPALVHQGSSGVELELPFVAPPRSIESIETLTGTVDVLLPGKMESFEFGGLADAKKTQQQRHHAVVTLDGVRKVNEVWEVRVRVSYQESTGAFDSHLVSWILNNEAYFIDSKGERVENGGFETTSRTENEIGVAYFFDVAGGLGDYKFVYKTPSTIYQLPVKYTLKALQLP
jgi:hypothetical protein